MRVVAGSAGGIHLEVPKNGLRPTMDQVKGAIFSSLGERVVNAHVLDLFAGTGGLGIEALSRGAASATLVEKDRRSLESIRKNLEKTKLCAEVASLDVFRFLEDASKRARKFDLIFADPPYSHDDATPDYAKRLLKNPHLPELLATDGLFVLEKSGSSGAKRGFESYSNWAVTREKRYGNTELVFFAHV